MTEHEYASLERDYERVLHENDLLRQLLVNEYGHQYNKPPAKVPYRGKCTACDADIVGKAPHYCNAACRRRWYWARRVAWESNKPCPEMGSAKPPTIATSKQRVTPTLDKQCPQCGNAFQTKRKTKIYCDVTCGTRASKARNAQ